jgi:hypothetical protein
MWALHLLCLASFQASVGGSSSTLARRLEVVAFKDFEGPSLHGPDYWLNWPMDLVTTVIIQGWAEPAMIEYAHAHGVRVLNTDGGDCYGDPGPIPWCANLSNATFRAEQVRLRGDALVASPFDGFGFDFEHVTPTMFDGIVQYVLELKAAYPQLFLSFYVGVFPGKVGWLPWDGASLRAMEPALDLVIAGLYSGINATMMPASANWSDCAGSCAVTDLREVQAALSDTTGPGWGAFVPKEKLVMGVGWYARTWGPPAPYMGRISFCQAVALEKSLASVGGSRRMDQLSSTWFFDCKHDLQNVSTWTECLVSIAGSTCPLAKRSVVRLFHIVGFCLHSRLVLTTERMKQRKHGPHRTTMLLLLSPSMKLQRQPAGPVLDSGKLMACGLTRTKVTLRSIAKKRWMQCGNP